MAQKMIFKCAFLLLVLSFTSACTRSGTEVGSPGTTRTVSGSVATTTQGLVLSLAAHQQGGPGPGPAPSISEGDSCPSEEGAVTVLLRSPQQAEIISGTLADDGSFSVQIDRQERYEIVFTQNGEVCGFLTHPNDDDLNGLRTTLGRGTQDIPLGTVRDLGNGIFVPTNNPTQFCDDDGDLVSDRDDRDADGDGRFDHDGDFDGYLDWFDEDDDGDGFEDFDDPDDAFDDECAIVYLHPSQASGFVLDGSSMGEIEIYLGADIASVNAAVIQILDSDQQALFSFSSGDVSIENSNELVVLDVTLDPLTEYFLSIPAGSITCNNSFSTESAHLVSFFTLPE